MAVRTMPFFEGNNFLDFERAMPKITYGFPDNIITAKSKRFCCPEVLCETFFIGKEANDIHDTTFQSIMKYDVDIRPKLYSNVVFSGGTTVFTDIMAATNTARLPLGFLW